MRGFPIWLGMAAALIFAGIALPYGVMGGGEPSFDILVFWCLFGLGVIVLIAAGVARWRL